MHLQTFRGSSQNVASRSDETSASTVTLSSSSQPLLAEERTVTVHPVVEVDEEDTSDVSSVETADSAQKDVSDVTQPVRDDSDETHVSSSPTDVDAGARSDRSSDGQTDEDEDNTELVLPEDFSVFLQWTELEYILPRDDSRGLVGEWATLMYRKFNGVYPTCALRFHYNYCRKTNSRKTSSPFWLGKAACRTGECITVTMTMPDEPVAGQNYS